MTSFEKVAQYKFPKRIASSCKTHEYFKTNLSIKKMRQYLLENNQWDDVIIDNIWWLALETHQRHSAHHTK
jgi:hypothetical protein